MISNKTAANAVGAKTARACDSCIRKRARWYCAADDAFLCEDCDSLVHLANSLARRHERVRLKSASFKPSNLVDQPRAALNSSPSWHRGFARKARTPRNRKSSLIHQLQKDEESMVNGNPFSVVPEVGVDENSHEENVEEPLLYRVPIFDPLVAELCTSKSNEAVPDAVVSNDGNEEINKVGNLANYGNSINNNNNNNHNNFHGFLPSDMDLAEFAADVESLLGRNLENECSGMEELGLMDSKDGDLSNECSLGSVRVKIEEEEGIEAGTMANFQVDTDIDLMREPFQLNFEDYDTPAASCGEEDEKAEIVVKLSMNNNGAGNEMDVDGGKMKKKQKALLSLDCEAVIKAWGRQGSPWTNGERLDFEPYDCWPDYMGSCGVDHIPPSYGVMGGIGGHIAAIVGGGREARVSRYREKRRTRLFSKKIRYEVRKLNAEKRPRMKGRFVKRTSFAGHCFS